MLMCAHGMKRIFAVLVVVFVLTSCVAQVKDVERAEFYLRKYPYWSTGRHAPPQSPTERAFQKEAQAFIAEHPRAAVNAAQELLAESKDDLAATSQTLTSLAFHKSTAFEPLFREVLEKEDFVNLPYSRVVIRFLADTRSRKAVPRLIQLGANERLRRIIIETLGKIGDSRAVPFLCTLAESEDMGSAKAAIRTLGSLRYRQAVMPLCNLLVSELASRDVQKAIVWALVDIGDQQAVPFLKLASLPRKGQQYYEKEPFWALLSLDPEEAVANIKASGNLSLAKYLEPEDALHWLFEVFNTPGHGYRVTAACELARRGERSIIPMLKYELVFRDGSDWLLDALFYLADPEAVDIAVWMDEVYGSYNDILFIDSMNREILPLVRRRFDRNKDRTSVAAICRLGDVSDRERVLEYWEEVRKSRYRYTSPHGADHHFVPNALNFFTRHKLADALPLTLRAFERDSNDETSEAALRAIGAVGGRDEALRVIELIRSGRHGFAAADAIVEIGDMSVIPELKDLLKKGYREAKALSAYCMAKLGDDTGRQYLADAIAPKKGTDEESSFIGEGSWIDDDVVEAIERLGDSTFCPALRNAMIRSKQGWRRLGIARALAVLGDEFGMRECIAFLKHGDTYGKKELIEVITTRGKSSDRLARVLEGVALSDPTEPRRAAIYALGKIGDRKTIRFLRKYPIAKRRHVIETLHQSVAMLEDRYPSAKRRAPNIGGAEGEKIYFDGPMRPKETTVDKFIELCAKTNKECGMKKVGRYRRAQRYTLESLLYIAEPRSIPVLLDTVRAGWPEEDTVTAIAALEMIGAPAAEALRSAYQEHPGLERSKVIEVFGEVPGKRTVKILIKALQDPSFYVTYAALGALASQRDPESIPYIEPLLSHKDVLMPGCAIRTIRKIGGPRACDALIAALGHKDRLRVVQDAVSALGDLGEKAAIPHLIELLGGYDDGRAGAREKMAKALSDFPSKEAISHMRETLEEREIDPAKKQKLLKHLAESEKTKIDPQVKRMWGMMKAGGFFERLLMPEKQVVTALRKLTGQKLEFYKEWKAWYETETREGDK